MALNRWLFLTVLMVGIPYSKGLLAAIPEEEVPHRDFPALCETLTESDCPGGVALLLAGDLADKSGLQRCSSFLIDSKTLVTNRHCVPSEVLAGKVSCKARLTAFFPKAPGFSEEQVECEEVVGLSDEGGEFFREEKDLSANKPDFAILRLSRSLHRPFFKISREGLPKGLILTAFTFDPLPGPPLRAVLRKKLCESVQNTDLLPSYRDSFNPVASFKGCPIVPGNSGSVAIDSQGSVRALVHAMWLMESEVEDVHTKYSPFSLMTNAACLPLSEAFEPRDPRCDDRRPLSIDFKKLYADGESYGFESEFQDFLRSNESPFEFNMKRWFLQDRFVMIPEITCVKKSALGSGADSAEKNKTVFISLPLWGPAKKITLDYRYKVVPSQIALMFTSVQFDESQLLNEGHTRAREIRSSFFTYRDKEIHLRLCSE